MEKERISSNHITSSVKHVVDIIMAWACGKTRKNFTVKIDNDPEHFVMSMGSRLKEATEKNLSIY